MRCENFLGYFEVSEGSVEKISLKAYITIFWISLIFMNLRFCDILFYSPKNVKSPYLHQLIYQILASLLKKIQSLSQKKMENIPIEILELVFLLLSSLKDIQKCFSTCSKWRKIILNIFKNKNSMCILEEKPLLKKNLFAYSLII